MYQKLGKKAFKKDLTNILALLSQLGNPHQRIVTIHVAGTNGKGSVSHLIASVLQEHGLKVGLYTSPHYKDFRERIKINGRLIDKSKVTSFVEKIKFALDEVPASFFEMSVAMAFDYFASEKVDVAIIETGLGGRLDSTNVILPELSVITNISLDHTDILGDTYEEIATEKAGIIKERIPALIGERQESIEHVFADKAKAQQSNLHFADELVTLESVERNLGRNPNNPFELRNIRTAHAAIKLIAESKLIKYDSDLVKNGIHNLVKNTYYIGRWQVLSDRPLTIADSAHNEAGLKGVLERLTDYQYDKIHMVIGFVKDKNLDSVLSMFPKDARYYFVKADIPRGLEAKKLKEIAGQYALSGRTYVSVKNGYLAAKRRAKDDDLVYIGGSIFVLAEIL